MKGYPKVIDERATLDEIISGRSIARYGDGELRVALGRKCVSQIADPALARELTAILADPQDGLLVGIPNINSKTPKNESWSRFCAPGYTVMYKQSEYASSFITRPDSAPWIDTPEYWNRVHDLWRDRDVLLIAGEPRKSLRADEIVLEAKSLRVVEAPRRDAYAEIDRIEDEIGTFNGPILMCLGCTATVLAARLHKKGLWGIDLGHIGMFMRHAGIYNIDLDELASAKYRDELKRVHAKQEWGQRGDRHKGDVFQLISHVHTMKPDTLLEKVAVLDYGCGQGSLKKSLHPHRVQEYDPGIAGKDILPKPADLVVCTDVLEHVEPKTLMRVLDHIFKLTGYVAYIVVATRPANLILPSGRNAHLIIQDADWWISALKRPGWKIDRVVNRSDKEVQITILKDRIGR